MTEEPKQPAGRSEVEEALLEAAADLMAERGPDAISGRDIAKRAGVNYGLLHHYFGPKAVVLNAALARLRNDFIAEHIESEDGDRLSPILDLPERLVRAVAFAELSPSGIIERDEDFPILRRELAALAEQLGSTPDDPDVRARAAVWAAAQLGWVLFEDLLAGALVGDGDRDELRKNVIEIIASVAEPSQREAQRAAGSITSRAKDDDLSRVRA